MGHENYLISNTNLTFVKIQFMGEMDQTRKACKEWIQRGLGRLPHLTQKQLGK